eukprot:INCI13471.15.p1 GENE.INCI13471.15~~INCI13471.15.p1  ORF type:complete len:519 (+),score=60.01 INCI13471.15:1619-3175(+)
MPSRVTVVLNTPSSLVQATSQIPTVGQNRQEAAKTGNTNPIHRLRLCPEMCICERHLNPKKSIACSAEAVGPDRHTWSKCSLESMFQTLRSFNSTLAGTFCQDQAQRRCELWFLRSAVCLPSLRWVDCVVQDVNLSTELALRRQHRARFQQALPVERAIDSMLRSGSAGGVVASKKEIGTKRTASDMGRGLPQAKRTNRAHSSSTSSDERHDSVATLLQQLIAADIPCLTDFASIPDIAAEVQVEETEISRQQTTDILRPTSRHTETGMAQTTIWGYSAGPDVKFQVELLQSGAHQSLVDSGRSMGTCATCHSATPTESGSYDTLVVRLVQGSELERAQRQLQNLGIHLRTAFGIEFDQILKTAAFSLMKYLRMMALSQWGQLQRGGGLRAVNQSVLQFVVWAWECKAEGTLQRLLFSENVLSQLGVVLQTFEAFDARSPTGSAQTMPSSAACSASSAAAQQSGVSARGCVFYMSNDDQAQVHKLVTRELGVVKTPKSVQASIDAISRSPPKGRVEVR